MKAEIVDECLKNIRTWSDAEKDIAAVLEKHGIEHGHAALFLSQCSANLLIKHSLPDEVDHDALATAHAFLEYVKLSRPDSLDHPAQAATIGH